MALTKPVKLGMSAAASWAWGTSLIVGVEIAQQKGPMAKGHEYGKAYNIVKVK